MTAPTTSSIVLLNTEKRLKIKLLATFADADETNVIKVDKSTYTGLNGLEPSSFLIEYIEYDVNGMQVVVSSDHTTDVVHARMGGMGTGMLDYRSFGGISTKSDGTGTGDIFFSTLGATSNKSYDVTLSLKKID